MLKIKYYLQTALNCFSKVFMYKRFSIIDKITYKQFTKKKVIKSMLIFFSFAQNLHNSIDNEHNIAQFIFLFLY